MAVLTKLLQLGLNPHEKTDGSSMAIPEGLQMKELTPGEIALWYNNKKTYEKALKKAGQARSVLDVTQDSNFDDIVVVKQRNESQASCNAEEHNISFHGKSQDWGIPRLEGWEAQNKRELDQLYKYDDLNMLEK